MKGIACIVVSAACLMGCSSYKQSVMFRVSRTTSIQQRAANAVADYTLSPFDIISLKVYTKNGERLVDPDNILLQQGMPPIGVQNLKDSKYALDSAGVAKLPMIGQFKLSGLTLREAELILQKEFARYYENVFVTLQCDSRRAIVLGASGGHVLPLAFEGMTVTELLALSKGFTVDAKAQRMRLLRGNDAYIIDFSTIEGYRKTNMVVQPGDILYVEPVRRPFVEGLRDYGQLISISTSILALILVATAQQ